jgi:hypothetical protein
MSWANRFKGGPGAASSWAMDTSVREPSIFVLGVQKCGTTTVADLLSEQPEIFIPSIKETYFFCDESSFSKGIDWYLSEFYSPISTGAARLFCDATPFYLASSEAMERIARYTDDSARFVVCLRDPVHRAYSAYWHQRRLGNESLAFEEALAVEQERIAHARSIGGRWWRHAYVEVGHYGAHLKRAFDLLGRERLLVLNEADLQDLAALQGRLRAFLDLPERVEVPAVDRSNGAAMPRSRFLQSLITQRSPLKRLAQAVVPRELRTALGRKLLGLNLRAVNYPPMQEGTKALLRVQFTADLAKLEGLGIRVPATWCGGAT